MAVVRTVPSQALQSDMMVMADVHRHEGNGGRTSTGSATSVRETIRQAKSVLFNESINATDTSVCKSPPAADVVNMSANKAASNPGSLGRVADLSDSPPNADMLNYLKVMDTNISAIDKRLESSSIF